MAVDLPMDKAKTERQLKPDELEKGMYVTRLDRPWSATPFLFQGFLITSEADRQLLKKYCEHVFVRISPVTGEPTRGNLQGRISYSNKIPLQEELVDAHSLYMNSQQAIFDLLEDIRLEGVLDIEQANHIVENFVQSILRNSNAMMWISQIKHAHEYTAEHCLRVAILSISLARELGLSEEELHHIGLCALLHDVGKMKVPKALLEKPGALSDEEFAQVKLHTSLGSELLMAANPEDNLLAQVALCHHERLNGEGYPGGLNGEEIPFYARIVAVVDVFDAINSDRFYRKGRHSMDTFRLMFQERGSQFDEEILSRFIRMLGLYAPGSVVEMNSGEVAIVISKDAEERLKPRVLLVRDKNKRPCRERLLDLKRGDVNSDGMPYEIKRVHKEGSFDIRLQTYLEKGVVVDLDAQHLLQRAQQPPL